MKRSTSSPGLFPYCEKVGISPLKYMKRYKNLSFWSLKRANRCILWQWKSRENVLVLLFIHSGAPRAKRPSEAPWVNNCTIPKNWVITWPTDRGTDRPSVRTTVIPMFTLTLSSFGSPGESWLHINVVFNWQLSKQGIRWPVLPDRIAGSGVDPSSSSIFLKLSSDNLLFFKWSQAQIF